jgi:hypothetical protein
MLMGKPLMTIPECAELSGISPRRMREIVRAGVLKNPDLVQGSKRRPLVQRDALIPLLGKTAFLDGGILGDHERRISALEKAVEDL